MVSFGSPHWSPLYTFDEQLPESITSSSSSRCDFLLRSNEHCHHCMAWKNKEVRREVVNMNLGLLGLLILIAGLIGIFYLAHKIKHNINPMKFIFNRLLLGAVTVFGLIMGLIYTQTNTNITNITFSASSDQPKKIDNTTEKFNVDLPDDYQNWKNTFKNRGSSFWESDARARGIPDWALDAGGSHIRTERIPGRISIRTRFPDPDRKILVGYSQLEATDEEARQAAMNSVVRQLSANLLWEIKDHTPNGRTLQFDEAAELAKLLIYRGKENLSLNEYSEKVQLDVGILYRAATRVDTHPQAIRQLATQLREDLDNNALAQIKQRKKVFSKIFSGMGIALCIFLIYCFLNAGTKGYFAWPLRIISTGSLIVIYILASMR